MGKIAKDDDPYWKKFVEYRPVDKKKYIFSIGNQFFRGTWDDEKEGFILENSTDQLMKVCDYFACYDY